MVPRLTSRIDELICGEPCLTCQRQRETIWAAINRSPFVERLDRIWDTVRQPMETLVSDIQDRVTCAAEEST